MLTRRLQVLIDQDQWDRLEHEARRRGVAVAALVRDAIDQRFPTGADERRAAFQAIFDAEPMPVPEPPELRRELDEARGRGLS